MRTSITSSVAILILWSGVGLAEGQTTAPPSVPVFGGAQSRNAPDNQLGLSVQVYEAYDDDVLAGSTGGGTPSRPSVSSAQSGFYSAAGLGLSYVNSSDSGTNIRSWANSALAFYPSQSVTAIYHQVGLALSAPLGARLNVYASPFFDYRPRYSLRLIPVPMVPDPEPALTLSEAAATPAPEIDYSTFQQNSYRYGGNLGLSLSMTNRVGIGVHYGRVDTAAEEGLTDMQVQGGGAYLSYRFTRNASLRAGYSSHEAKYELADRKPTRTENINVGVDYRKPLSITRRTHLQFGTGSAISQDRGGNRRLHALGSASLVHQMGRSWSAQTDYRRSVGYLEGFNEPVLSDSAGVGISGLMSRRLEFSSGFRYFTGAVGLSPNAPKFDSYATWARLRTGLSRSLAAYAEYFFYHYEFVDEVARPTGLPPRYNRNGVRLGLTLWVPLVG